ncbi:MAG: 30S ribosomal protein S20 [Anaerolineales bacterium]
MATKSSQKRDRQNEKRRERNRKFRGRARTLEKKALTALTNENLEEARQLTADAVKALDKAAAKGVIHDNNAARRKSRMMKRLSALEKEA